MNTKCSIFPQNSTETMPCCEISDCAQMSKTTIAVRHFWSGCPESLETAVKNILTNIYWIFCDVVYTSKVFKLAASEYSVFL